MTDLFKRNSSIWGRLCGAFFDEWCCTLWVRTHSWCPAWPLAICKVCDTLYLAVILLGALLSAVLLALSLEHRNESGSASCICATHPQGQQSVACTPWYSKFVSLHLQMMFDIRDLLEAVWNSRLERSQISITYFHQFRELDDRCIVEVCCLQTYNRASSYWTVNSRQCPFASHSCYISITKASFC